MQPPKEHDPHRYLEDVLRGRDRWVLRGFATAWLASVAVFGVWWFRAEHWTTVPGMVLNTVLLGLAMLMPSWFYLFVRRMKRPRADLPFPTLRTAMVVTKAPAEPWQLVRGTLLAMLRQDIPGTYDVWLADEAPSAETRAWCAEHGVRISCRQGVAAYHRPTWPRRTRCKEGNLAYFYDHHGYRNYDVVAQLDADHAPGPTYLRRMVEPFAWERVGYVAAPSVCDRNAATSWSARGRLYVEAMLHGPTQAGCSDGYAPSCIGSHYAVRTAALREIGGLGPELAEDFTTTLMMSAHGWEGVFALDAEAHGDGPECFADAAIQEFQWSRSLMNVLLRINPRYWRGLSWRARLRLGYCQVWYPLFATQMMGAVVVPVVALLTRVPLVDVPLGPFFLFSGAPTLVLTLTIVWLRHRGWLRPPDSRIVAWEAILFQLAKWPWVVMGCVHSVIGCLRGREPAFRVTPKGVEGTKRLPLGVLTPYLVIAVIPAATALATADPGPARGYYFLALLTAVIHMAVVAVIALLHWHENGAAGAGAPLRLGQLPWPAPAAVALLLCGALALRGGDALEVLAPRAAPAAGAVAAARTAPAVLTEERSSYVLSAYANGPFVDWTPGPVSLELTTPSLAVNPFREWDPRDLDDVDRFERGVQKHVTQVMWFADWAHNELDLSQLWAVQARGSVPEITWEPWDYSGGPRQPEYSLSSIVAGRHDAYIERWAERLKAYGGPLRIRFAQEMNGTWYPWAAGSNGEGANGNRPGEYVAAWRHVHDIFRAAGADNARWVWSPLVGGVGRAVYPGDAYVDLVGLSGFNGGAALAWGGWRTFEEIFGPSLRQLRSITTKPIVIAETGSSARGGDRAAWIRGMFAYLKTQPDVTSVTWFDVDKEADWSLEGSPECLAAIGQSLADPRTRHLQLRDWTHR